MRRKLDILQSRVLQFRSNRRLSESDSRSTWYCKKRCPHCRLKRNGNMTVDETDDYWIDLNTPLLGSATMGYSE